MAVDILNIKGVAYCQGCDDFGREADQSEHDPGSVHGPVSLVRVAASRHARATGHRVWFTRSTTEWFGGHQ